MSAEIQAKSTYVEEMTNKEFIDRFSDLVFGENREKQLSKFIDPVRVRLFGSDKDLLNQYRPKVAQIIDKLRNEARIDIAMANENEKANYAFIFSETPIFEMLVAYEGIPKLFAGNDQERFYANVKEFESRSLKSTTMFIALNSGELKGCMNVQKTPPSIKHEKAKESARGIEQSILYCLGLKRHVFKNDNFSIRTNKFERIKFSFEKNSYTKFDIATLKLLYNENFSVGLNFKGAHTIITDIVNK